MVGWPERSWTVRLAAINTGESLQSLSHLCQLLSSKFSVSLCPFELPRVALHFEIFMTLGSTELEHLQGGSSSGRASCCSDTADIFRGVSSLNNSRREELVRARGHHVAYIAVQASKRDKVNNVV